MGEYIPQKPLSQQLEELSGVPYDEIDYIAVFGSNGLRRLLFPNGTFWTFPVNNRCTLLDHFCDINNPTQEEIDMFKIGFPTSPCPPFEVADVLLKGVASPLVEIRDEKVKRNLQLRFYGILQGR